MQLLNLLDLVQVFEPKTASFCMLFRPLKCKKNCAQNTVKLAILNLVHAKPRQIALGASSSFQF